jgi:apolipoprotein N-acyltransferase
MNIPLGDFNAVSAGPPSFAFRGERIGANICYADLVRRGARGALSTQPRQAPTIFANLSNIGWFGDTLAIAQHPADLADARARVPAADAARDEHPVRLS